ncbi:general secretion pathway protein GspH [Stutzerimonas stutzeri]|uniref:Type II secretion system protein H n=1 Tax=Stutzerimonas stutzeri TaxID=316 RepID=W8RNW2_STUST|nr:type II secretion system minor pseudopilin GspH [Stutzerimonas stutzeri]AHL73701.1 general secretion pathway protein GspH [Stutzerimonas stutzeri]MCQ4328784.1 type II secretion system minor pseudopilin GspH [Stutzerimonas stutzeri]
MRRARRNGGFTLIELLVVIVILGSLVGLAMLSIGSTSSSREVRDEAQRLATLIGLMADEAVLDSREYGLLFSRDGYRVMHYDEAEARWRDAGDDKAHIAPEWIQLELELDGSPLKLVAPVKREDDPIGLAKEGDRERRRAPRVQPQLLILSSGELSPFTLTFSDQRPGGTGWVVSSDGFRMPRAEPQDARR